MGYNLITKNGYSLFEIASALQKDIRRSNEKSAMFWAHEIDISNFGEYLWKRLVIISIEDVGPADHDATSRILALKSAYDDLRRKKSKETNLAVAAAVIYLARSGKSRLYDWCKCYMVDTHAFSRSPIPDYALDMHTSKGKSQGKNIEDFFNDGCKVHPHLPAHLEEEYMNEMRALYRTPLRPRTDSIPEQSGETMNQGEFFHP